MIIVPSNLETASLAVVALLLFITAKPMLQGASRLTELCIHMFGTSNDARKRNLTTSSELSPVYQDIIVDTVVKDPILPGVLIYAFSFLNSSHTAIEVEKLSAAGLIICLVFLLMFGLFKTLSSLNKAATKYPIPAGHIISTTSVIIGCLGGLATGISAEAIVAALIVITFITQIAVIGARGARNYGVFAIVWAPVAIFCWLSRVFALSIAAPVVAIFTLMEVRSETRPLDQTPV